MADFKLELHSRYLEDGRYVGLTGKTNTFDEDCESPSGGMMSPANPEAFWPSFGKMISEDGTVRLGDLYEVR
jgi:hypothetical protein